MRFIKYTDGRACLALTRQEALQIVHDLVNQLSDAPGAASQEHPIEQAIMNANGGVEQGDLVLLGGTTHRFRRLAFMLDLRDSQKKSPPMPISR